MLAVLAYGMTVTEAHAGIDQTQLVRSRQAIRMGSPALAC